ncbi:unnamed protein product [Mycena citricolor]|uniref:Uncharacterized protein n=1 Tax=Mycena citricolor TaxID=2018698 RepID=A0AAD2Q447_9AGAR|nr:unnamed protein product [Mycena citricolor]
MRLSWAIEAGKNWAFEPLYFPGNFGIEVESSIIFRESTEPFLPQKAVQ